jgi:hypothetical protein
MTPIAVIAVDGVLRDEASSSPIPVGRRLYDTLANSYRLFLVEDEPVDPLWLLIDGFVTHQTVINRLPEDPGDKVIRRIRQLERIRGMGGNVEILVDPDPLVAAAVTRLGVICLHYVDPPYARPEFHPAFTDGPTPWNQMVEELEQQKIMRAHDTRMFEED